MSDLTAWALPEEYRVPAREHIFGSPQSLAWFCRVNAERLKKAGAVGMFAGRKMIHPDRFDQVVEAVALDA